MLTGLSIRNVVLIEALDLEFGAGLTALTGETGAGKSIILDALGMATGARSDRGLVRAGTEKALCTASFTSPKSGAIRDILDAQDIEVNEAEDLTLRRSVSKDGRSKAFINDQPVGVKLLSEVGSLLLEVHGQHDGKGLLDPATHIHLLDLFGGYQKMLGACAESYTARRETQRQVEALIALQAKAKEDRDFLEHAIGELDRLAPRPGEDAQLAEERRFLQGAEGALKELTAAEDALGEDGAFEQRLNAALAGIERVRGKFGDSESKAAKALSNAAGALERALLETQEARTAVSEAAQTFDVKPGQLDETEKRLFSLRAAARKYDCDIERLVEARSDFATQLASIDNAEVDLSRAEAAAKKAKAAYDKAANALSKARQKAAKALDKSVVKELPPLKMERAQFITHIEDTSESALGIDKVRFQVSTNPGTALGPLDKIASGGEMARFALAIKVALAGKNDAVMVFDEVDQGVGGAVADAVGKRLALLSSTAQVFVVTHSPQVAARAAHQYLIKKSSTGTTTTTNVTVVADDAREEEIARMLAGETVTQEARAAARQLMAS